MQNLEGYFNTDETRAYLGGISAMTLYRLETIASRGFPPAYRIGRKKMFEKAAVDAWMKANRAAQSVIVLPAMGGTHAPA